MARTFPSRGKITQCELNMRPVGPQSPSGHFSKEKSLSPLPGIESLFLGLAPHGLVSVPTELPWLRLVSITQILNVFFLFCIED